MIFRDWLLNVDFDTPIGSFSLVLTPDRPPQPTKLRLRYHQEEDTSLQRLRLWAHSEDLVSLRDLRLRLNLPGLEPDTLFYANGYQSWSTTREYSAWERQEGLNPIVNRLLPHLALDRYGESFLGFGHRRKRHFHGWGWCWLRRPGAQELFFVASLNEDTGFTRFEVDYRSKVLRVDKDVRGLSFTDEVLLVDVVCLQGELSRTTQEWSRLLGLTPPRAPRFTGWTSWYSHYQNISEEILLRDLEGLVQRQLFLDVFQIDDGYQQAVGDWFDLKPGFPRGMVFLARRIHQAGFLAGLWLAPLAAERTSRLAQKHPEWLLKDAAGTPLRAGGNWSGFYALDILLPEVQDHLRTVFRTVLDDWGYDLVKLDFLYASCLLPRQGHSRAQIMAKTMEFLRGVVGSKYLLACGVPLASALGRCDYCRIGTDVEARWSRPLYERLLHPEIPSTRRSLTNTLYRWFLNGVGFHNDPDVFFLRSGDNHLSPTQRHSLFLLNYLLGNLWMTSDLPHTLGEEARLLVLSSFPRPRLEDAQVQPGPIWKGSFRVQDRSYLWVFNSTRNHRTFRLPEGWYAPSRPWQGDAESDLILERGGSVVRLRPSEAQLWLCLVPDGRPQVLGSVGHLLPGNEVLALGNADDELGIDWVRGLRVPAVVWVGTVGPDSEGTTGWRRFYSPKC